MPFDRRTWSRIKGRKMFQWAVAYLAGAWLLIEVVDVLTGQLGWPFWVFRTVLALVSVGFAGALVAAWYHGEKGRQKVSVVELVVFAGLVLIAAVMVDRVVENRSANDVDADSAPMATATPGGTTAAGPSIAVLPFENVSGEPEQEYFGDGLAEELMDVLGRVPGLRVAARTSAFAFEGRGVAVNEIRQALGVSHVLEGSVRQDQERVRVAARLVDTRDGLRVWGDTYDRELEDIVHLQRAMATDIVQALRLRLVTEAGEIVVPSTHDPQAYRLYLEGRYFWHRRTLADLHRAVELFQAATDLDPDFARAWAGLAQAYAVMPSHGAAPAEALPKAAAAADRALQLDSTLAEAHAALASVAENQFLWDEAAEAYRRSIELDPREPTSHQWYGMLLQATGNVQQGLREARLAHELDPLSFIIAFDYGWQLVLARRYDDGIRQLREAADLDPSHPLPPGSLGIAYLAIGSEEVALECLTTALANTPERWDVTVSSLAYGYAVTGRTARARELLGEVLQRAEEEPISEVMLAYVYVGLGDLDEAFHWLREAVAGKDWLVGWGLQDPAFDPLRGDPRFDEILAAARLPT